MAKREAMKTLKAQQRYGLNKPEITDIARLKKVFSLPLPNVVLQHLGNLKREEIEGKALFERLKEYIFSRECTD